VLILELFFASLARFSGQLSGWSRRGLYIALLCGVSSALSGTTEAPVPGRTDPLDQAAGTLLPLRPSILTSVDSRAGWIVAVGPRGTVLRSNDGAKTWKKSAVPVSSDLTAVKFVTDQLVWAVGHDAVVLRSVDAGATWSRVLDGRSVHRLLLAQYAEQAGGEDAVTAQMRREVERSARQSATPGTWPAPFLDIWFADPQRGFVVGAFGLLLATEDGGKTWTPWLERADNERRFHLYGISGDANTCLIVGEQGLVLRLDAARGHFVKVNTPYNGTYFGAQVVGSQLVVHGLRGNAYASADGGRQWSKIATGSEANVVAALADSARRLWLVTQAGEVLPVGSDATQGRPLHAPPGSDVLGATLSGQQLILARVNGPTTMSLAAPTH
jgi:photosystem II stability/assembly factor-like uncharacterized protein